MAEDKEQFEEILKRLEEIVEKIESTGLGLEESMSLYEEGIKKAEKLNTILSATREKVMKLVTDKNGNPSITPLDEESLQ